ncbi:hypothetical protein MC885_020249, partial [Smutsia gigantea]
MVPAAGVLLWALLLSLGPWAAGAQGLTTTGLHRVSFRFGGSMTRGYPTPAGIPRSGIPPKRRVTVQEDEDDVVAAADRLASPAAAELLASTVATGLSQSHVVDEEDGSLEEGVWGAPAQGFLPIPRSQKSGSLQACPPTTWKSPEDLPITRTLDQWSTAGATPRRWPSPSPTAMPPPEDLRAVLMPWGPWHCHCKSGTMRRTRAGKLHGLSRRLRVGALSQLRTEHRPCNYRQCPCDQLREECPLDAGVCPDTSGTTQTTASVPTSTSTAFPSLSSRLRPSPFHFPSPSPSPSPALAFWRRVSIGLEDIWNSLSSEFTEMQP